MFPDACTKTEWRSTCCGLHAFGKLSHFCCGGTPVKFPFNLPQCTVRSPAYNWTTQTCISGLTIDMPMSICPNGNMHFCCGGMLYDVPVTGCVQGDRSSGEQCCGLVPFNLHHQRCCGRHIGTVLTRNLIIQK